MQYSPMTGDDLDFAKDSDSDQPGTTQEDPRNAFMFGLSIFYPTWHGDVFVKCLSLSSLPRVSTSFWNISRELI